MTTTFTESIETTSTAFDSIEVTFTNGKGSVAYNIFGIPSNHIESLLNERFYELKKEYNALILKDEPFVKILETYNGDAISLIAFKQTN